MTGLTRLRPLGLAALLALCMALALPVESPAASGPTYTKESLQAYESQLKKGEIASATFNRRVRSMRLTLKSGAHVLYSYPSKGAPKLVAELRAKGIPVTVLKNKHKTGGTKHTRRYIAVGIVVLLVIAGAAFLLIRRRRSPQD